jgi:peptidylprolyl isomerase
METTNTPFERGSVGLKRTRSDPDRADSQFFVVLGPARNLDGDHTVFGRVIFGIDAADKLRPGSPPDLPDRILSLKMAADPNAGAVSIPCRDSDRRLGSC